MRRLRIPGGRFSGRSTCHCTIGEYLSGGLKRLKKARTIVAHRGHRPTCANAAIHHQINSAHQSRRIACQEQCRLSYIVDCPHIGKRLVSMQHGSGYSGLRQLNSLLRLAGFESGTLENWRCGHGG